MQLFRILLFLLKLIITISSNVKIEYNNEKESYNKTLKGNISLLCDSKWEDDQNRKDNLCNMTKVYCDTGDCIIETKGTGWYNLNNLFVDARNIQSGYKFQLKCGTDGKHYCKNITVLCPTNDKTSCICDNCPSRDVSFHCEDGVGVYCTGTKIVPYWKQNNVFCDVGLRGYGISGKYICSNVNWSGATCKSTWTRPTQSYSFAPNDKCAAFQYYRYNWFFQEEIKYLDTVSCRETINSTTNEYKYHLPICVKYVSKPNEIPELKQYFNITRIIIKNKTNIINKTNWIDKERINWINKTRWINKTNLIEKINWTDKVLINWINLTRWINKTNIINKTNEIRKIINQSILTIIEKNENNKNSTSSKFVLDLNNIFVLGGLSVGGLIILSCTFYVSWKCWLQEKVEDMIMTFFLGEEGVSCLERVGCFNEYFQSLREIKVKRNDMVEYYGLTPEEIAVCKQAKAISKIKYQEAINMRFEELAKHAVRPRDSYHKELFKKVIKEPKKNIEMSRQDIPIKEEEPPILEEKMVINILPGTPRRRLPRRSMEI